MTEKQLSINLVELPHQQEAIHAIMDKFPGPDFGKQIDKNGLNAESPYANPLIKGAFTESNFIDVKMETGTGKTYTYTRMMYELHQSMGMFKFIVVVPSAAIKEGARSFLTAEYAKQHFKKFFPKTEINVGLVNAGDFGKKGRKEIPNAIREFAEADLNDKNQIQVLLLNDKGFLDRNSSSLFKKDYEANLFGGDSSPVDMLAKTRPIVIIDEPHRIKRNKSSYTNIQDKLKPEMIVRFGATFPEVTEGRGKNKMTKTDYFQGEPQYDLNAVDSFNQGLVKGVAVYTPKGANAADSYTVKNTAKDKLVLERQGRLFEVKKGDQLSEVDSRFQGGLTYQEKGLLSNSLEVEPGMKLVADVYTDSYQKILIQQALDAHFESERENFLREGFPVKTNALFFIDNIDAYRDRGNGHTWLKDTFEELLSAKLKTLIENETDSSYKEFLQVTLDHITDAHGGYFASDAQSKKADDKVAEEVDVILRNKNKSLRLKNEHGDWNILRFFFSQWTLREGWDNPNVFTIAKLRSSGSDISKLQEVGRGLRLPVDVEGNRLDKQEWWLNFVVDSSEKDFANRLLAEINGDAILAVPDNEEISDDVIEKLVQSGYGEHKRAVLNRLADESLVDDDWNVINGSAIQKILPKQQLTKKIRNGNPRTEHKVKLVQSNWNQIKDFWKELSRRYMLVFDRIPEKDLQQLFFEAIRADEIFDDNQMVEVDVQRMVRGKQNDELSFTTKFQQVENLGDIGRLAYNRFIRLINQQTNLPTRIIHSQLVKRLAGTDNIDSKINERTLSKIVSSWQKVFMENYATRYHYDALKMSASTSVLKGDHFVDAIAQGALGDIPAETEKDQRNLFEEVYVDSIDPEQKIAQLDPGENVKVFGKIPRRAIQVPTYIGGTTTPDFVYATKNNLFLLIEAKPDGQVGLRDTEKVAVESQRHFFNDKKYHVRWEKVTKKEEVQSILNNLKN